MIQEVVVREPEVRGGVVERLERMPLFQGFSPREIERLAWMARRRFLDPRETVFAQGAREVAAYVVLSGVLLLEDGGAGGIGTMVRSGGLFGEESLFDEGPRSHGARAVMRSQVLVWAEEDLARLEREHPRLAARFLRRLARPMTQRWRRWVVEVPTDVSTGACPRPPAPPAKATFWQTLRERLAAWRLPPSEPSLVGTVQPGGAWEPVPISRWPVTYEG